MLVLETPQALQEWRKRIEREHPLSRVGFVPTMGALHAGHGELLKQMKEGSDLRILSIFVNPAQFGPKEDLSRYPRTWDSDVALAQKWNVDVVYAPTPAAMYPSGFSTWVEETQLSSPLCGEHRPGHFKGVTTVVLKLFNAVRPHRAWFGLKDAQQFLVLKKMVTDLDLDVDLVGVPTVREEDGLALSSRNRYLSPDERKRAAHLYGALRDVQAAAVQFGRRGPLLFQALEMARLRIQGAGMQVQYLELRRATNLSLVTAESLGPNEEDQPYVVAVAAWMGTTRLIDNLWI